MLGTHTISYTYFHYFSSSPSSCILIIRHFGGEILMEIIDDDHGDRSVYGNGGKEERGMIMNMMYLMWEDLSVVVPNFGNGHTRRLLDRLTGFAEPNRIMAIMGPSGSGKSTLLDALAGMCVTIYIYTAFVHKIHFDFGCLICCSCSCQKNKGFLSWFCIRVN